MFVLSSSDMTHRCRKLYVVANDAMSMLYYNHSYCCDINCNPERDAFTAKVLYTVTGKLAY